MLWDAAKKCDDASLGDPKQPHPFESFTVIKDLLLARASLCTAHEAISHGQAPFLQRRVGKTLEVSSELCKSARQDRIKATNLANLLYTP